MSKFSRILGSIVRYLVATVSLSVVLYILFALIFSTEEERRLQRENNLYKSLYKEIRNKDRLIGDVVDGLLVKDDAIYRQLFETTPPSLDAITAADLIADSDSLSESFYLSAAASAPERLMMMSGSVDDNFAEVFRILLKGRRDSIPPLCLPLKGMSYVQTGASVGPKHNPVFKLEMQHDGIDFIAPQGAPVYAANSLQGHALQEGPRERGGNQSRKRLCVTLLPPWRHKHLLPDEGAYRPEDRGGGRVHGDIGPSSSL